MSSSDRARDEVIAEADELKDDDDDDDDDDDGDKNDDVAEKLKKLTTLRSCDNCEYVSGQDCETCDFANWHVVTSHQRRKGAICPGTSKPILSPTKGPMRQGQARIFFYFCKLLSWPKDYVKPGKKAYTLVENC